MRVERRYKRAPPLHIKLSSINPTLLIIFSSIIQTNQHLNKMFAATFITALFASSVVTAMPADLESRQVTICSGTYSNAQCCATDVLGLADLDCANRE